MKLKGLIDEDFIQYKQPSMFVISAYCDFKCDKEFGSQICQNSSLATNLIIDIDLDKLIKRYLNNPITKSIVIGGLEPLIDPWFDNELLPFISAFRKLSNDMVVIYTGYNLVEVQDKINRLKSFENIIIKFGRFIPNQKEHFDQVLGVNLASPNQYAIQIS